MNNRTLFPRVVRPLAGASLLAGLVAALLAFEAQAMTYFLVQDLGVQGNVRRCKYNNGKIYTVNATELCAMSVEEDGPLPPSGQTMGFLVGEYQDGMTKVCVYDVLGNKRALRLNSVSLCPLNAKF